MSVLPQWRSISQADKQCNSTVRSPACLPACSSSSPVVLLGNTMDLVCVLAREEPVTGNVSFHAKKREARRTKHLPRNRLNGPSCWFLLQYFIVLPDPLHSFVPNQRCCYIFPACMCSRFHWELSIDEAGDYAAGRVSSRSGRAEQ